MNEQEILRERVEGFGGPFIDVWHVEPPAKGVRFQVLREEWNTEVGLPERHIYAWRHALMVKPRVTPERRGM